MSKGQVNDMTATISFSLRDSALFYWQCLQIEQQYRINNQAAIALQCKSNVKLNSCLSLCCV